MSSRLALAVGAALVAVSSCVGADGLTLKLKAGFLRAQKPTVRIARLAAADKMAAEQTEWPTMMNDVNSIHDEVEKGIGKRNRKIPLLRTGVRLPRLTIGRKIRSSRGKQDEDEIEMQEYRDEVKARFEAAKLQANGHGVAVGLFGDRPDSSWGQEIWDKEWENLNQQLLGSASDGEPEEIIGGQSLVDATQQGYKAAGSSFNKKVLALREIANEYTTQNFSGPKKFQVRKPTIGRFIIDAA